MSLQIATVKETADCRSITTYS